MADTSKPVPDPKPLSPKERDARGTQLVESITAFAHSHKIPPEKAPGWAHALLDLLWALFIG
jgi:hypothetical protein